MKIFPTSIGRALGTACLILAFAVPAKAAVTRAAYLQMSTPTGMSIRWRTDVSEVGRVRWGSAPGSLTNTLDQTYTASTEHEVRITGLSPATTYYYSIGNASTTYEGGDVDHRFKTHPPVGSTGPYRFWVIGDAGRASATQMAVRDSFLGFTTTTGIEADLWLQLGDNAYDTGTDAEFQAKNFAIYPTLYRQVNMYSCIGNHEGTGAGGYYPSYTFPTNGEAGGLASGTEAYYSVDYGNVHFVSLDSQNSSRAVGGAQYLWLQNDLAGTTQPWIVVMFHHPPYTKGSHDSDTESQLVQMRQNFNPLMESYGVDLVLGGHSHSYERSQFIDGHYGVSSTFNSALKSAPTPGMLVQAGYGRPGTDGAYLKYPGANTGAVYVVDGASGQADGGSLNHAAHKVSLNIISSLVLDVNGGTLNATTLDGAGGIIDTFTILKASLGTPTPTRTPSPTFSESPTFSASPTPSFTVTDCAGCSATETPSSTVTVSATPTPSQTPSLNTAFPLASAWKYNASGAPLSATWMNQGYNDAAWPSGSGVFGVEATPYGYTINAPFSAGCPTACYPSTYYRKTFDLAHLPAQLSSLTLKSYYDDGFVLYINGVEAARAAMPAGAVTYTTLANDHESTTLESFDLAAAIPLLVQGTNTVAVELHQRNATSSDVVFDASLEYGVSGLPTTATESPSITPSRTTTLSFSPSETSTATPSITEGASPTDSPTVTITPSPTLTATPTATFIAFVALPTRAPAWRYLANNTPLLSTFTAGTWAGVSFDDSAWGSGAGVLGLEPQANDATHPYPIGTGVSAGCPSACYPTTYYRKSFTLPHLPGQVQTLTLKALYDDGFILYINNVEAARRNVAASGVTHTSFASGGHEADTATVGNNGTTGYVSITISPALLVSGNNVVAVELHNQNATSSDLVWDLGIDYTANAPAFTATASPSPSASPSNSPSPAGTVTSTPTPSPSSTATLSSTQTPGIALVPGDIAFTGYNGGLSSVGPVSQDDFSFVLLRDVPAGTSIKFTDKGVCGSALFTGDSISTWTATSNLNAGTQVRIWGLTPTTGTYGPTALGFSATNGDQVTAFQGVSWTPSLLAVLDMNGGWNVACTADTSNDPGALLTGGQALTFAVERDNAAYQGSLTGNAQQLIGLLNDPANWASQDGATLGTTYDLSALSAFNVLAPGSTATYSVTASSTETTLLTATSTATPTESATATPVLTATSTATPAAGTLAPGDFAFVGYNSGASSVNGEDNFAFIFLRDIPAGTTVRFSDKGVCAAGTLNANDTKVVEWTSTSAVTAGTPIWISGTTTSQGSLSTTVGTGALGFSTSGDQVTAFLGATYSATVLGVLDSFGWSSLCNASTSEDPRGYWPAAFAFTTLLDNALYNGPLTGNALQLMAHLTNAANWSTQDGSTAGTIYNVFSLTPFNVLAPGSTATFSVTASSTETTVLSPTSTLTATVTPTETASGTPALTATSTATPASASLAPGDFAFIGYNSGASSVNGEDNFAFIFLKDIPSGTTVRFSDKGVCATGTLNANDTKVLDWTSTSAVTAGTPIWVSGTTTSQGSLVTTIGTGALGFSTSGDQVTAFLGATYSATVLGVLDSFGWSSLCNASTSEDPRTYWPAAFAFSTLLDNALYTGPLTGNAVQLMTHLTNAANWSTQDGSTAGTIYSVFSLTPLNVLAPGATATFSPTATLTATPVSTESPTSTATASPSAQGSSTFTSTPTSTSTPSPAFSATHTATPTPSPSSTPGTALVAGDAGFTGYVSSNPDAISFVLFKDIVAGTVINVTDKGWTPSNAFYSGDGVATWTASRDMMAGEQVLIYNGFTTNTGSVVGSNIGFSSTNGDQCFLFQGTTTTPTLIAAIQMNGDWDSLLTTPTGDTSVLPGALSDGFGNCVYCIAPAAALEKDDAVYNCSTLGTAGLAALKAAVFNPANWTTGDLAQYPLPPACNLVNGTVTSTSTVTPAVSPTTTPTADLNQVVRGPYLQMASQDGITLRWRTSAAQVGRVWYGFAPGSLTLTADESGAANDHEIRLSGLPADTQLYYGVGNSGGISAGGDAQSFFRTHPVSGAAKALRVWVLGDSGFASLGAGPGADQRRVRDAYYSFAGTTATSLALMLGDNAYNNGTDVEYQAAMFENMYEGALKNTVFWPTIGNHESDPAYFSIFNLPTAGQSGGVASGTENYYSFDQGRVHFICLDSQFSNRSNAGAMHAWMVSDLQSTSADWIVAFWHHPPYSHGSHNSDSEQALIDMRENFASTLEDYGVDLVLSGHSHAYERSHFIDGFYGAGGGNGLSANFNSSYIKQAGAGPYLKANAPHAGAIYAVAGSSGEANGGALDHAVHQVSLNHLGSMVLDINGDRLDAKFLNDGGVVEDSFSIIKSLPTATPTPNGSFTATITPAGTLTFTPTASATRTASPSPTQSSTPLGTSLSQGDVMFTGYSTGSARQIAFVLLKDVAAGTQVGISNQNWTGGPGFATTAGHVFWTADQAYAAGTQVLYTRVGGNSNAVDKGLIADGGTTSGGIGFSNPKVLTLFQGTVSDPTLISQMVLGQSYGGAIATAVPTNSHGSLVLGQTAMDNATYRAFGVYACAVTAANAATLRSALATLANWNTSTSTTNALSALGGTAAWTPCSISVGNFSATITGTFTATPTPSSTATPTVVQSATFTTSGTHTQTAVVSATSTATPTVVQSATSTATGTYTQTPAISATPTATPTPSSTASGTAVQSATTTPSRTPTLAATTSSTPSVVTTPCSPCPTVVIPSQAAPLPSDFDVVIGPMPVVQGQAFCVLSRSTVLSVDLYNLLAEKSANSEQPCVDTRPLAPGIYFARVELVGSSGEKRYVIRKVIIVR